MIRGVRGAITVDRNEEQHIIEATEKLLVNMIEENEIEPENVASVFISVTDDINSVFPAKALRKFNGWTYVPVMCMQEIPVPNSLKFCIRIMIHLNTELAQQDIRHAYLEKAIALRPDLKETQQ
ncbi:chorismate mutase [Peribacillus glennii]|uniref:chorismate mutase n=1 Tax=Peribacillus glennii TaxID=2303991 RepID=A0A372LGW9_9BACI|nr:chorismate mutase [Peribacillus glennii]RFU65537.1 chorismate mutase [Peribacillus glennii]